MKTCRLILLKDLTYTTGDISNPIERKILKGESVLCSQESVDEGGEIFILSSGWGRIERDYFFEPVRSDEQREKDALRIQVRLIAAGACGCIMNDDDEIPQIDFALSRFERGIECMFEPNEEQSLYADYSSINLAIISLFSRGIRAITEG